MMKKLLATGVVLAVLSVLQAAEGQTGSSPSRPAAVGELEYLATSMRGAQLRNAVELSAYGDDFGKPTADSGTVNPHATVATIRMARVPIRIAIDAANAEAGSPDLVRFDFSGKGKFDNRCVCMLRKESSEAQGERFAFGPAMITVHRDTGTIPVTVLGDYAKLGNSGLRMLSLRLVTCAEGVCKFAGKTYPVRITDYDGNLLVGDRAKPVVSGGKIRGMTPGDVLTIDVGDGTFQDEETLRGYWMGQPMFLDGTWFDVRVSEDRKQVTAEKLGIESGRVKVGHARWSADLIGEQYPVKVKNAGADPVDLPAGKYVVASYTEQSAPVGDTRAMMMLGYSGTVFQRQFACRGTETSFQVPPGGTVDLSIGTPMSAAVEAQRAEARTYVLSLKLLDAAGQPVALVTLPNGQRPERPQVRILNSEGKEAYKCTLEYG